MHSDTNRSVIERLHTAIETDDAEAAAALVAPDFVNHAGGDRVGPGPFIAIGRAIRETFPDARRSIEDVIAAGDRVVVRETLRGTHRGSALPMVAGIPPAGRTVEWTFIHIFRLRDGLLVEHWAERNDLDVRRQLGT